MSGEDGSKAEYLRELGRRVRRERERRGWRQEDLAKRVGLRRNRLVRIETGRVERVTVVEVRRLARAFDVEPGYLLVSSDHPCYGMLRHATPSYEQSHLLDLAADGLAMHLLQQRPRDPEIVRDLAKALLDCPSRNGLLSQEILRSWLEES